MEVFYSLAGLDTKSLRELYLEARGLGYHFVEYDKPGEIDNFYQIPDFPLQIILDNIWVTDYNIFCVVLDIKDPDYGITVGFYLRSFPYTTAYVRMDNSLLERFVKKYRLEIKTDTGYMGELFPESFN